jgi:DNA polymerase-3 subunit delta
MHERECLTVEAGFDWGTLAPAWRCSPSLFTPRRLLELRRGQRQTRRCRRPSALSDYAARPAEDAVLLITAGKLDWNTQKSRWFAALEGGRRGRGRHARWKHGNYPVGSSAGCERSRSESHARCSDVLAERVEGNLLAAAQEIEKLAPDWPIDRSA